MKIKNPVAAVLLILAISFSCLAQDKVKEKEEKKDRREKCTVYFVEDSKQFEKDAEDAIDDDKFLKKYELGSFFATGGEGSLIIEEFPQTKTKLFVIASVFYEDDLFYDDILHDAITLKISVSKSKSVTGPFLSFGAAQAEYTRYFGAAKVTTLFEYKGRTNAAWMECKNLNPVSPFDDEAKS